MIKKTVYQPEFLNLEWVVPSIIVEYYYNFIEFKLSALAYGQLMWLVKNRRIGWMMKSKKSSLRDTFSGLKFISPAELGIPSLGCFKRCRCANPYRHFSDLFFPPDLLVVYFVVEDGLHVGVSGSSTPFFPLTAIFPPTKQISPGNSIFLWYLLHIMSVEDLELI